jgi:hypothetical protein
MSEALPPDLSELQSALKSLTPEPPRLDRDRVIFRAGQAQARRWYWPAAALVSSAVAACLALVLILRPAPPPTERVTERIVYVKVLEPAIAPAPPAVTQSPTREPELDGTSGRDDQPRTNLGYYRLQQLVLRIGLENLPALPMLPPPAEQPIPAHLRLERGSFSSDQSVFPSWVFPSGDR